MNYTIDTTTWRTPNYYYGLIRRISGLVIHTGEGPIDATGRNKDQSDLRWLCMRGSGASCTYYVDRVGHIFQLADEVRITWHAAEFNEPMLGIETEHRAGQDWPKAQVDALTWLCRKKITEYRIEEAAIYTHRWLHPHNRSDPTDWDDARFKQWRASLYQPLLTRYRVTHSGVAVRNKPGTYGGVMYRVDLGHEFNSDWYTEANTTVVQFDGKTFRRWYHLYEGGYVSAAFCVPV